MAVVNSQSVLETLSGGSRPPKTATRDSYDFIVVGGGTAGLVLANRLTEDRNVSVVVLEAGEDLRAHPRVTTPALFTTMVGSDADWNLQTEPQKGLNGRRINIPLGRALGGSSAINGQTFIPSSKLNIDMWEKLGNPGWNWEVLSRYYAKSHSLDLPTDQAVRDHLHLNYIDSCLGGADGPIKASFPNVPYNPLPNAWVKAMNILGHAARGDPFSGEIMGAITNAATIEADTRQRSYSASAYLHPIEHRPNLTVISAAYVNRIIFTGAYPNIIATGVEYTKESGSFSVQANEEVILAAGALHTPKLLEISGIGGNTVLEPLGIYPIIDNPHVGENLQDHPLAGISFEVREGVHTLDGLLRIDLKLLQEVMKEYQEKRTGPFAVGGIYSYAFLALQPEKQQTLATSFTKYDHKPGGLPLATENISYVNELLLNSDESSAGFSAYSAQGNYGRDIPDTGMVTSDFLPGGFYSISVCLLQPLSRGCVHVQSVDHSIPPKIDPGYLSHPLDLEVFAQHMTFLSKLISTAPLADLLKPDGLRNQLAPKDLSSVSEMKEYLKKTALSNWHPTSTCAMLPESKGGVVSERLIVHGTRNLRIVDASIFPITTRGNPMATVYAVAERASDLIKEEFHLRQRQ